MTGAPDTDYIRLFFMLIKWTISQEYFNLSRIYAVKNNSELARQL